MKNTTTEKAKRILREIDKVLDVHQRFHAFAINNDRVQLLINTNKVIEGLTETRKMFETHLINEGVITRVPVTFITTPEPPTLRVLRGGGQNPQTSNTVLTVVPKKPIN